MQTKPNTVHAINRTYVIEAATNYGHSYRDASTTIAAKPPSSNEGGTLPPRLMSGAIFWIFYFLAFFKKVFHKYIPGGKIS